MSELDAYQEQTETMIWDLMALTHPTRAVVQCWLENSPETLPELVRRTLYAFMANKPDQALDGYVLNYYKLKDALDYHSSYEMWPSTFPPQRI